MSEPRSETNTSAAPESQPKRIAEPVYTYAVSWGWLIAGLVCALGLGGIAGATYYIQNLNMPRRIVDVVQQMIVEADSEKARIAQTDDIEEKGRLMQRSLRLRNDAANLLYNFRRANPDDTGEAILGKLYDILETLYRDHGENATSAGRQRGAQLSELALELARTVDEAGSIRYRTRLLELEWDRRNFEGIISRGKELLSASQTLRIPENYDAMRYTAMAFFDYLAVRVYDPSEFQLSSVFPDALDELLGRLNSQRPDDIEIARRYAEFLVSVEREGRANFTASASDQLLRNVSVPERFAKAKAVIDAMVQHNTDNSAAYLARYHFVTQYSPPGEALDLASPDLARVLELAPNSAEGLILSALHALRQMGITARGEETAAAQWESRAEEYLRRTIKENPSDPLGYQYLGEYLLLVKNNPREAVDIWNEGLKNSARRGGNEELIGRLVMLLLQQGMVDEARSRLGDLLRTIDEMRATRPRDVVRTREMHDLLNARLSHTEANLALGRIETAIRENRREDAQRLYGVVQQKRGEAVQRFEAVLINFGVIEDDYILERRSVYYSLLPQSLLQLGQLKMDMNEPDSAASYFSRAARFDAVLRPALIGMSIAYQQGNRLDLAAQVLQRAVEAFPEDLSIRYTYTMVLFRSLVGSNATTVADLDKVQRELDALESFRSELPQPWILDIRRIHLGVARANLSNQADTVLEAMNEAVRRFRALERQTFPPDEEGNVRSFIEDHAFVSELVGIYSSLSARSDFDRLLEILRAFPEGEDAYFEARINDALRRDSRNEAIEVIDEAIESPRLSQARKNQFAGLLQNLKGETVDRGSILDRVYEQLRTTFDENPESLRPQAFFMLAKMSLDRGETDHVQQIRDRLERLEGPTGTHWRYIAVRQMLAGDDPDFDRMREIQEQIVSHRADWDESYILATMIDERYLAMNPGDTATQARLIAAYRNATQRGNLQPEIWQRLAAHLDTAGRADDARAVVREAALRGVMLESRTGQLPQPYGRMYSQVQAAIANEDPVEADMIAQQCIRLAEIRGERPDLIFTLHLTLGKVFLDASMFESAIRHLTETSRRGGTFVYPLALSLARSGDVDGGFSLLLDEIDRVPSAMPVLLPAVLVLLAQVQPSEAIFERIDTMMTRIQRGERLTLRGTLESSDEDHVVPLGTKWVESRRILSLVVRFPESTATLDPSAIQFIAPDEFADEEEYDEEEYVAEPEGVSVQ